MTYSNKSMFLKTVSGMILSGAIIFGGLISCSEKNKPQPSGANNSTFFVDDVKKLGDGFTVVGQTNANGQFDKKLIALEACLKDNAESKSVSNINFKITAGEATTTKVSDPKGCVQWVEVIEFNPNDPAKSISMVRMIEALEKHSGSEKFTLSVNPWDNTFSFIKQSPGATNNVNESFIKYKTKDLTTASVGLPSNYDFYVKINDEELAGTLADSGNSGASFYIDEVKFVSSRLIGEPNALGQYSKLLLGFEACVLDAAKKAPVTNVKFKLSAGDLSVEKTSSNKGCIFWQEVIDYIPTGAENFFPFLRVIQALQSQKGSIKFVYSYNPWSDKFIYDKRASVSTEELYTYMDKSSSPLNKVNHEFYVKIANLDETYSSIKRQTEIDTLRLKYKGIDYQNVSIDEKLNLTVPYTYVTDLSILFLKQSLGRLVQEKIKMGKFMFHLVFLKEHQVVKNPQPEEVVAGVSFKGSPLGDAGLISVPITINFKNLTALSSRMSVLLTVTSLDEPALFPEQTYEGMVNGISANEQLEISLIPNDSNAHELLAKYNQKVETNLTSRTGFTVDSLLSSEGFKLIENANVSYTKTGILSVEKETVDLAKSIQNLQDQHEFSTIEKRALCSAFFQGLPDLGGAWVKSCLSSPEKLLSAEITEFVNSTAPKIVGTPSFGTLETLVLTSVFQESEDTSFSKGYDLQGNIGANLDAGFNVGYKPIANTEAGIGFKFGLGGKVYSSKSYTLANKDVKGISLTSTEALTAQQFSITMSAEVKKCLLISAKPVLQTKLTTAKLPTSRYLCAESTKENRRENYYLLDQAKVPKSNSIADTNSQVVNPLRMLVRGTSSYSFLKSIITNKYGYKIGLGKMTSDQILNDPSNFMTQEAPLMLSSTRKVVLAK
ncbi:MAG: hypothetical protein J0M15_04750 [Deltaproteobacteria bacterium]|nr:hypothetical protein [Deltaproteobacteria bacterium]